ncbi:unnamed protein product [Urochloa decumbens]|uniref:Uncharacterized protein n=1 Tax=Urochloa decumbens TaxID=240449 RepID=A0ABC8ZZ99_9POAL
MAQMWNQIEDGERAMGESYHVDLSQPMALSSEADEALLMELMEDLQPSDFVDGDMDRLSHVIQSLEAEIGAGEDVAVRLVNGESVADAGAPAGAMDDMLLDLDQYEGGSFGYWPEVSMLGHEAEGWYVYSNGYEGVVGYEAIDHQYQYHSCVEGCVEQVYSPLWE